MGHRMDMPAAQAAKLVKRTVVETKDGEPVEKQVAVKPEEVLAVRVCEASSQVIVVTNDGQKLFGELPAKKGGKDAGDNAGADAAGDTK